MNRTPAATPETDPVLARIIELRNGYGLGFPEIGRQLMMQSSSAQQRYSRYYQSQGLEMPVRGNWRSRAANATATTAPVPPEPDPWGAAPPAQEMPGAATIPREPAAAVAMVDPPGVTPGGDPSSLLHRITIPAERRAGWSYDLLCTADHHFDHVDCERELLRYHLDQARDRGAGVVVVGDLFCAMQGKLDRRASKPELRPEYLVAGYMDAIVDDALAWYGPYAQNLKLLTYGNHETKVTSYQETDILRRFHQGVTRQPGGEGALLGRYAGWLCVDAEFPDGAVQTLRGRYHHGWGGGGPVTLGVIGTNRQAAAADYDFYIQGHIHECWEIVRVRETVGPSGQVEYRSVPHICCGPYKNEGTRGIGWHVETGKPVKPLGGRWLRFYWSERQQAVLVKSEAVDL